MDATHPSLPKGEASNPLKAQRSQYSTEPERSPPSTDPAPTTDAVSICKIRRHRPDLRLSHPEASCWGARLPRDILSTGYDHPHEALDPNGDQNRPEPHDSNQLIRKSRSWSSWPSSYQPSTFVSLYWPSRKQSPSHSSLHLLLNCRLVAGR